MQIICIIIITNKQPGTTLKNDRDIPKKTAIRRMCNFKKVNITLWPECFLDSFLDIITTYSSCFETLAEKSPCTKICCMEDDSAVSFFTFFDKYDSGVEMGYQYVSSPTQW